MAKSRIEVGFLNVVATPHPKGIYAELLRFVAGKRVKFWGAEVAAITPPVAHDGDDTFLNFRLIIWTEVDPNSPAIDKNALEKADFPREGREFARAFGVNGKVFYCIFDTLTHTLTMETLNDTQARISVKRAERIFSSLLSPDVLGPDRPDVQVTAIPKEGALKYVLGLSRIDKVEILLKIPNNDDITDETNRLMEELRAQNVKNERITLTRQAQTPGIKLNQENKTLAEVAASNGYVETSGLDKDGEHESRSTREVPKIVKRTVEAGGSFLAALRSIAFDARGD